MIFEKVQQIFIRNKYLLAIILLYLILRLINLTLLPIFNDEGIYLDWGWRETHTPDMLFYSLYDAKQPFLMWIFGIFESFIPDPLFAGRLVSVICGFGSLLGIYAIGKTVWDKSTGFFASLLYAVSPLFLFYDRQALMESAIAAVGIWSCYFLIKIGLKSFIQYSAFLGLILGIGFFIKSNGLIFLIASLFILVIFLFKNKQKDQIALLIFTTTIITCLVLLPLILQLSFWDSLKSNARFSLTTQDLLQFPIQIWVSNILVFLQVNFFFLTPLVMISSIIGLVKVLKNPSKPEMVLLFWLILTIGAQILMTRNSSLRYIVSFLPLLLLFTSASVMQLSKQYKTLEIIILLIIPFSLSLWQIVSPTQYILSMSKFTSIAPTEYVEGQTSGYGIDEIRRFINGHKTGSQIIIGIASNTGNPESAIEMYYQNSNSIIVTYMERKLFGDEIDQYDCINPGYALYFISRENQLAGLDKFFTKVTTIHNPYGTNTFGIYKLTPNCTGKTAQLRMAK